jgi:hypothetical protein
MFRDFPSYEDASFAAIPLNSHHVFGSLDFSARSIKEKLV